jgi:hypothetical protein
MADGRASNGNGVRTDDRRRAPRFPLVGVLVTVISPDGEDVLCASDALDISTEGIALVLPEQADHELDPGDGVLVSFRLDDGTAFARIPCRVVRRDEGIGGLEFTWDRPARRRLAERLATLESQPGFSGCN